MRYFIDSNVLSELWKPFPDHHVLDFMRKAEWYLPVPVIAEIQEGRKRPRAKPGAWPLMADWMPS